MTAVAPEITDEELLERYRAGDSEALAMAEERDRADAARKRAAKIRSSSRERHAGWEAAAYANYLAADADTRGNLLSDAGRRTGREPWPMLWEGSEERARRYASEDLERFWDYVTPRPPSPGEYATAEREAAAEARARADMPSPGMLAAIAAARGEPGRDASPPVAAKEPGSIVRFNAALAWMTRTAEQTARSLERVNGGIRR